MTPRERITWLRTSELVTAAAFLVAFVLGTVHWVGLALGGALVGLLAPTLRRAFVMGLYLGGSVALAFCGWLWLSGALSKALAAQQLFLPSLTVALVVPVLGAGVRGFG